ncbi:lytic transglycosylase domain-containing protein [Solitalea lacus]|uniref:lytic transglycosylase domain-containing protein n=1 Tax=Solitalea lacus TaxID=2911172 RepID=UPI001EDAFFB2|nr:lytic transglycosylase domain-containing protein [Solitalea lacus]UKJ08306.1 lytic transglycosylase domain-containing protein [Solitalea lacus]
MKKHFFMCALLIAFSGSLFVSKAKAAKLDDPYNTALMMKSLDDKKAQSYLIEALTFSGEAVPFDNNDVYQKFIRNLNLRISQGFIENLQGVALKWFPIIEPILAQYGIPEDFKFLPAIESGFKQNARSHAGAVGYWQFMPATAKAYGLKVSRKVDDRKDIVKSTVAACRYLNDLYERLGSWTLVAAAYNVGHGALESAMNRQNESDYFDLKLNKETGNYVYKVLVFKHILQHAGDFDLYFDESSVRVADLQAIGSIGLLSLGALTGMGTENGSNTNHLPKPVTTRVQPKTANSKKKLIAKAGRLFNWI